MDVGHPALGLTVFTESMDLTSGERTQFIDLTDWVTDASRRSGVTHGLVQVQALHTTAAIMINENEPLLLEDFGAMLERLAPGNGAYAHDDPARRAVNLLPEERPNGSAHARALLIGPSKILNIRAGRLELGRWQSVFFIELDGPRPRTISLTVIGQGLAA